MCIIAVSETGTRIDKKHFDECWRCNKDGAGIAWIRNDGKICFIKGLMSLDDAWAAYQRITDGTPHICHFRIASVGGVCAELTHPFICSVDSPIHEVYAGNTPVLFHNGTYTEYKSLLVNILMHKGVYPAGKMSDSRAIAAAVGMAGNKLIDLVGGKVALMSKDGITLDSGHWQEDDGIKYSNGSFRLPAYTTTAYSSYDYARPYERGSYTLDAWKTEREKKEQKEKEHDRMVKDFKAREKKRKNKQRRELTPEEVQFWTQINHPFYYA